METLESVHPLSFLATSWPSFWAWAPNSDSGSIRTYTDGALSLTLRPFFWEVIQDTFYCVSCDFEVDVVIINVGLDLV